MIRSNTLMKRIAIIAVRALEALGRSSSLQYYWR
jgi:hypothetical protein